MLWAHSTWGSNNRKEVGRRDHLFQLTFDSNFYRASLLKRILEDQKLKYNNREGLYICYAKKYLVGNLYFSN